jgi:hypothetical protein
MIALAAICFSSVYATTARPMTADTTKKKVKVKTPTMKKKIKTKHDTTKVKVKKM